MEKQRALLEARYLDHSNAGDPAPEGVCMGLA